MYSHMVLGTNDLAKSIAFYNRFMPVLGFSRQDTGDTYAAYILEPTGHKLVVVCHRAQTE